MKRITGMDKNFYKLKAKGNIKITILPLLQNLLIMFSLLGKKGKTKWKPVETAQIINPNAPRKLATSSWADETNDIEGKHYQIKID